VRVCGSQGCAAGYGYCASSHLDIVLEKMTAVVNTDMKKKSGGFLGLMSDKSDGDIDKMKCTAFLCYGYAAAKADVRHACPAPRACVHAHMHKGTADPRRLADSLIKSRIDVHILSNVLPFLQTARAAVVKVRRRGSAPCTHTHTHTHTCACGLGD
jgi:hypothetical protein